eukprot:469463_1
MNSKIFYCISILELLCKIIRKRYLLRTLKAKSIQYLHHHLLQQVKTKNNNDEITILNGNNGQKCKSNSFGRPKRTRKSHGIQSTSSSHTIRNDIVNGITGISYIP